MFVDASAVVAILRREAGWEHLAARLEQSDGPILFSPIVVFEATVSLARQSVRDVRPTPEQVRAALAAVTAFIDAVDGAVVEITPNMGTLAIQAASTYGKAVGHPADLNFGDCFTYACARALSQPLLYKGNDFAQTDIG